MKKRISLVLLVGTLILLALPAGAAFPGRNGRIVFWGGYFDNGVTTGCTQQSFHTYTVARDGSRLQQIDEGLAGSGNPHWAPGGRWVAFNGGDGSTAGNEIYVVKADGSSRKRLTNNEEADAFPSWSPGGGRIVYEHDRNKIAVMSRDGDNRRIIKRLDGSLGAAPAWSPDGARIAYRGSKNDGPDLFTMRPDGTGVKRLTDWSGGLASFDWSPSGKRLVVVRSTVRTQKVYAMNRNGRDRRLIYEGSRFGEFSWSPNGRSFIASGTGDDCGQDLFVLDRSGSVRRRISPPNLSASSPDWQPL